jgi:hypothetical protein
MGNILLNRGERERRERRERERERERENRRVISPPRVFPSTTEPLLNYYCLCP